MGGSPWGFDSPAPTFFFGGNIGLTAGPLTGGVTSSGFTVLILGAFFGGLYKRKLGYMLNRVFRVLSLSFNDDKRECKGGLPLQTNICVFLSSLCMGNE